MGQKPHCGADEHDSIAVENEKLNSEIRCMQYSRLGASLYRFSKANIRKGLQTLKSWNMLRYVNSRYKTRAVYKRPISAVLL